MYYSDFKQWVGQVGSLKVDGFFIPVHVSDARSVFGRIDLEVTPTQGTGTQWVSADRVEHIDNTG